MATRIGLSEGDAVARAVHDLLAPLTVIRGLCATLGRDEAPVDRRRRLALIDGEVMRLAAGLEGLAARAPRLAAPERVCLAALAGAVVERHAVVAAQREVRLGVRAPRGRLEVEGRPAALDRALENLVANALRHAGPGGEVAVVVSAGRSWGHVRVHDDGDGVAPADRARIFRAGERGSAPRGSGRGLGLAIARQIAEEHRGRLALEATTPGACFRLSLPLAGPRRRSRAA